MNNQLQRAMNLARKTGDRIIVIDDINPDNSFVIMDFESYEELATPEKKPERVVLTDRKISDNINRDKGMLENREDIEVNDNVSNYFSPENIQKRLNGNEAKKRWSIGDKMKNKAEEVE